MAQYLSDLQLSPKLTDCLPGSSSSPLFPVKVP